MIKRCFCFALFVCFVVALCSCNDGKIIIFGDDEESYEAHINYWQTNNAGTTNSANALLDALSD